MNASTRAHTNGGTSGSRRRQQSEAKSKAEKGCKEKSVSQTRDRKREREKKTRGEREEKKVREQELLHPPPLETELSPLRLTGENARESRERKTKEENGRDETKGRIHQESREREGLHRSSSERVFREGLQRCSGRLERVFKICGQSVRECWGMFANYPECSGMFGEVRRIFLWTARAGLWTARAELAPPLLLLDQAGRCRHNSSDFEPAGKATCCSSSGMHIENGG